MAWSKTKGAPSFLPDSFAVELVELGRSPYLFDLRVIQVQDDGVYVLQGPRLKDQGSGAREATFWIDSQQWVIEKAEAAYPSGQAPCQPKNTRFGIPILEGRKPGQHPLVSPSTSSIGTTKFREPPFPRWEKSDIMRLR